MVDLESMCGELADKLGLPRTTEWKELLGAVERLAAVAKHVLSASYPLIVGRQPESFSIGCSVEDGSLS